MSDTFADELKNVRSEKDLNAFIQRHASDQRVMKMLQMCKGRNSMEVAQNLAQSQQVDLSSITSMFGFNPC